MTANRQFPLSGSGADVMAKIAEEGTALYNAAALPLTNVAGGTANNPKTACAPVLSAGLLNGMSFWWTAVADNSGPMTMVVDGNAAVAMKNDAGQPLGALVIKAGQTYKLLVWGGIIIVMNTAAILKVNDYQVFTASGTWLKPAGCPANALVTIEVWAGGGGGGSGTSGSVSGGGGGGYVKLQCKAGDLAASVSITIGAGGTVGVAGGASSFGSLVQAYGGGAGTNVGGAGQSAGGGGGGGALAVGGNSAATGSATTQGGAGGDPTAGNGATGVGTGSGVSPPTQAVGGQGYFGGGGGGSSGTGSFTAGSVGGKSVFGGGGGSGRGSGSGAISLYGGNGGAPGAAGQAPAGGGGSNASGARGEVRVYING